MNKCVSLRQMFMHLCQRCLYIVLCLMVSGAIWGKAVAQQKGAGVRLATNPNGERRVALVIGNSNYATGLGKLKNPANDATDVAALLKGLDFELIGGKAQLDVNLRQMDELVRAFGREIRRGGVGVFYFSGHGIQVNRLNYLLPLGALIEKEQDVPFEALDVERVLSEMEAAENSLNILILDACRNNPLTRSFRSGGKGLARPESVPVGTYLAFAAKDGQVASDNTEGRNGLYTQELLKNIGRPGLRLEDIFINTRREVRRLSQNAQTPVEYGSIDAPFYFVELDKLTELGSTNAPPANNSSVAPARAHAAAIPYYERGLDYYNKKDYDRAIAEYATAIDLDPKYAVAYNNRGNAYFNKGEYDRAIADQIRAIELEPKYAAAYNNRGNAYYAKREYDRAIADQTRAIELDPKYVFAYNNRGNAYYAKQDYDRAIADQTRAIELDPTFAAAYNNRGNAYYVKQDYDRAIADHTTAIELNSKFVAAYNNRGEAYYAKQEYDRAIADLMRAIELDPKFVVAYNNRGSAYYNKREYDRAMADYTRAIELDPKYAVAYNNRGSIYYSKREYDRAIADYTRAIELDPKNVLAYRYRSYAYEMKGDSAHAAADRQKAADLERPGS